MDELRELVLIVKDLPGFALWAIFGVLVYKVTVIGSIFGVARLGIVRLFDWLTVRKTAPVDAMPMIEGMTIKGTVPELIAQLARLKYHALPSPYIHAEGVARLRRALDLLDAQEAAEAAAKSKP